MNNLATFFSAYKDALITVGWVIAAVGWLISNSQANRREKRKETRAEIDAICKSAAELVDKCRRYYAFDKTDTDDERRVAEIFFEMKRFLIRSERLAQRVPVFHDAVASCGDFWHTVTGEPFDTFSRKKQSPRSNILEEIEESAHNLMDKLEGTFTKEYHVSWWTMDLFCLFKKIKITT